MNYANVKRTDRHVIADVTLANATGAWYQVTALQTVNIPELDSEPVFLLGPFETRTFRNVKFRSGEYLEFDADRNTEAVWAMLTIDLIGRGLFGVEIETLNFAIDQKAISTWLTEVKEVCAAAFVDTLFDVAEADIAGFVGDVGKLMSCSVQDPKARKSLSKLLDFLYGKDITEQWIAKFGDFISAAIELVTHLPKLQILAEETASAELTGFSRLEARP